MEVKDEIERCLFMGNKTTIYPLVALDQCIKCVERV